MKISDKELRETVGRVYSPLVRDLSTELLQRRREVRRLRAALRMILAISTSTDYEVNERMDDVRKDAILALKPQRGAK